jgi:hypothetical protein
MGGTRDGLHGTQARPRPPSGEGEQLDVLGGGDAPGTLGLDEALALDTARIIARVTKDWDPPSPRTTPEIAVGGTTLAQAARELDQLPEWGQAGGSLRAEPIAAGNSTNLTVHLHANLLYRLPRWRGYAGASPAAQAEWDRMFAKLKAHEDRHLAIAIEEAEILAQDLVSHDISDIASMVTAANRRMQARQDDLDHDTDHGAKAGVQYGDVILDTSIT